MRIKTPVLLVLGLVVAFPGVSLAVGSICISFDPAVSCPSVAGGTAVSLEQDSAVNNLEAGIGDVFDNIENGEKEEDGVTITFKGAVLPDGQVYLIPIGYSFSRMFRVEASIPYILTDEAEGIGNVLYTLKIFAFEGLLTSFGVRVRSGDEEVVETRDVNDRQLVQSLVFDFADSRIFANYSFTQRPKDGAGDDPGDTLRMMLGFDTPIFAESLSFYLAAQSSRTGEDKDAEGALANELTLVDASLGLVFRSFNLRIGVTLPVSTDAGTGSTDSDSADSTESATDDPEDREVVIDFGIRIRF